MIPATAYHLALALENAAPMPKKPIPIPKGYKLKDGKLVKSDTAPPHVRAGRRRKAGKVTGVRPAK